MEMLYDPAEFIRTSTGNIISRKATIYKPQSLELPGGKVFISDAAHLRADLAPIQLHKYAFLEAAVILRPGLMAQAVQFIPMTIGSHTSIARESIIIAASIGMGCVIGSRCILGARCILKDYVRILDDTVIPPDMVLPPFAIVGGCPGAILGFAPETVAIEVQADAVDRYNALRPQA